MKCGETIMGSGERVIEDLTSFGYHQLGQVVDPKDAGFEPLRAWFQALYEVLLGQSQGPRFGSFAAIFGLENTIALMERALAGELIAA